jgi:hypothetical protein
VGLWPSTRDGLIAKFIGTPLEAESGAKDLIAMHANFYTGEITERDVPYLLSASSARASFNASSSNWISMEPFCTKNTNPDPGPINGSFCH